MLKSIIVTVSVFLLLLLLPLLWSDQIILDLGEFTTEWYKSIFNVFVIGLIALFFNRKIKIIETAYIRGQELILVRNSIKKILRCPTEYLVLKSEWNRIKNCSQLMNTEDWDKIDYYVNNINEYNAGDLVAGESHNQIINVFKKLLEKC